MKDIEDALQAQSAMEGCCDLIVTRNEYGFKKSGICNSAQKDYLLIFSDYQDINYTYLTA